MLIKRSNIWHYQTKLRDGRTFHRSTRETDRSKALEHVPSLERLARLLDATPSGSLKLSNLIMAEIGRIETDVSPSQANRAAYAFESFLRFTGDVSAETITHDTLTQYQRRRLSTCARDTVHKELFLILRLLRRAGFQFARIPSLPGVSTPNRPFAPAELQSFFAASTPEDRPLYLLLLSTGARLAEIVPSSRSAHIPLLKTEVHPETNTIDIRSAKQVAAARRSAPPIRTVTIPAPLTALLLDAAAGTFGPHVFAQVHNPSRRFDAALRRAGIPKLDPLGRKLTLHSLRHTYATLMAAAVGHNPHVLQAILGHTQITTTQHYVHITAPPLTLDLTPYLPAANS